jgi:hypothetical protein
MGGVWEDGIIAMSFDNEMVVFDQILLYLAK